MLDLSFFRSVTGSKSFVHTHLNYLVIVALPFIPSASSTSTTVCNFARMTDLPAGIDITQFTVFDLENKLVVYSGTFEVGVREVVSQISCWRMVGLVSLIFRYS
jgi:vacuolar protein sorting-associated protein 11